MPEMTAHPSQQELAAYNLGQLPPEEAAVIESHIGECQPCCETIVGLSSEDTFVALLQEARQLPADRTVDLDGPQPQPSSSSYDIPAPLAEHPRYEIVGLIGKGGMGEVYKATHRMMKRTVALKIIKPELVRKPEAVDRFQREVTTAAQLSHPNIVTAHDAEQAGDVHFLVMEFVDGIDLSQVVKQRGALPIEDACNYARQAAIGLQYAYERGMVHRDIKPHNLMVMADGTVKILDFGLASLAPEAPSDVDTVEARGDLTAAGAIMGTPDFISPEQADDARQADIRSDIYSLGTTLYFLLSARPPFADGSVMHKLKSHAQAEPEPLESLRDDIPADLAAVVAKMIAKDPNERFQTPAEAAEALESFSRASQRAQKQPPQDQVRRRRERSRVLKLTAVATLFLAAIVAAIVYYIQTNNGIVRVEVADASLEVTISDQTVTMGDGNKEPLEIRAGKHKLIVRQRDSDFEFETDNFQVRRNGEITFSVKLLGGQVVVRKEGKNFKSKALKSAEPLDSNTELGNANQIETEGKAIEQISATALVNGCEVTGGFTVEQAEIAVKNPTSEAREVSFYYQVVYQNSRDRDDIFQLRGGSIKETVPPGREAIKRVDTLPDPNASMPVNFMKDLLVIRISRDRLKEFTDIPIHPTKKLDIASQPVTIASQATPGYSAAAAKQIEEIRPEEVLTADELIRLLTAKHGHLVPKLQKMMSEAAGIPNAEWHKFAADPSDAADAIKGEPLSLVLWKLNPLEASTKNLRVLTDFQYIGGVPKPKQLSDAMFPSQVHGYYSMIQPHYISGLTFDLKQGTKQLKGNFRFQAPNLYAGKIEYVVQIEGDDLRVVEFCLPNYGIRLVRGEDGLWEREDIATPSASSGVVRQSSEHEKAANTIKALSQILDVYKVDHGNYPTTEAGWKALSPLVKKMPIDPWGNAFGYEFPGTRSGDATKPDIWSNGPDETSNTDDDIGNWLNKSTASPTNAAPTLALDETEKVGVELRPASSQKEATRPSGENVGLSPLKPKNGTYVETDRGYMVPYRMTIPGTEVSFEMVPVPGAKYQVKPQDNPDNPTWPLPIEVTIEPFWMARHEVTWAEYHKFVDLLKPFIRFEQLRIRKVTSENQIDAVTAPSELYDPPTYYPKAEKKEWPQHPAVGMTQYAAKQYTKWLSKLTEDFYRLPSEVEWEYACRAGSTTSYHFGDDAGELANYAWYLDNSAEDTHPVGLKKPNRWGLHDMHGNVSEWVLDEYNEKYVGLRVAVTAGQRPIHWPVRMHPRTVRGGSWDATAAECRSTARVGSSVDWHEEEPQLPPSPNWLASDVQRQIGFRIVRPLDPPPRLSHKKYWDADALELKRSVAENASSYGFREGLVDPDLPSAIHQLDK